MADLEVTIPTAPWTVPLVAPARYKGARGGRSRGASHFFASLVVEEMVANADLKVVCIREYQTSLRHSVKSLVEAKIRDFGFDDYFRILEREIRRVGGDGICIFLGMQDHTADSLKSLEGFGRAWVEEAQNLSRRSLELLKPTIRAPDSELWFSWNPEQPDDPVEDFLVRHPPANAVVVTASYLDNPFAAREVLDEAEHMRATNTERYEHVWLGGYNTLSEAAVLAGRYRIAAFEPVHGWGGPYQGCDFGFARDPMVLVRCWVADRRLWVEYESYHIGLRLQDVPDRWAEDVPDYDRYVTRADPSAAQSIAHLQANGVPRIEAAPSWPGSVKDGIRYLHDFTEIVIHERCVRMQEEARLYSYKVDKRSGDILPELAPGADHVIDSVRYACGPMIRAGGGDTTGMDVGSIADAQVVQPSRIRIF